MKKLKNISLLVFTIAIVWVLIGIKQTAYAAEISEGSIYQVSKDTQIREKAQNDAKKIADIASESVVIVKAYDGGDWCEVTYGDVEGYMTVADLKPIGNAQELNQEFENIGNDYENIFDEVQEIKRQKRNSRIWGTIIVILVVAIFGVGIVSAVKKNKEESKEA